MLNTSFWLLDNLGFRRPERKTGGSDRSKKTIMYPTSIEKGSNPTLGVSQKGNPWWSSSRGALLYLDVLRLGAALYELFLSSLLVPLPLPRKKSSSSFPSLPPLSVTCLQKIPQGKGGRNLPLRFGIFRSVGLPARNRVKTGSLLNTLTPYQVCATLDPLVGVDT